MDEFPVSIRAAARRLEIPKTRATRLVNRNQILTEQSPVNPKARMLSAQAFAELARLASRPVTRSA